MRNIPKKEFGYFRNMNMIIVILTYSDVLVISAWGLITPFLSIFAVGQLEDGTVAVAGFAMTIFLVTRSVLQFPVARWVDKNKGEYDDFWLMIFGTFLMSLSAIFFAFAYNSYHVYFIQIINGVGYAFATPGWNAIFSRHLDKGRQAMEWTFYDISVNIGTAITASLGGLMIYYFDFRTIFIIVGLFSFIGTLLLLGIRDRLYKR